MTDKDKHHFIQRIFLQNAKEILKSYDEAVARAGGKKHFILISQERILAPRGMGYKISFQPIDDPGVDSVGKAAKIAILNSEHELGICVVFVNTQGGVLVIKYDREDN